MTKFWALIWSNRPKIYNIGEFEDADQAEAFAIGWCDQKNEDANKQLEELKKQQPNAEPFPSFDLVGVLNDEDMRLLTGEIHRPRRIARKVKREEVPIVALQTHGGEQPEVTPE